MRALRDIQRRGSVQIYYKVSRVLLGCLMLFSGLIMSGCAQKDLIEVKLIRQEHDFDITPCKKPSGEPYRIGFMDLGPPIESSYLCLKGLAEGLKEMGYLGEQTDLSGSSEDFFDYYERIVRNQEGNAVIFDDEPYMIDVEGNDEIAEKLKKKVENGELDVIVATGTDPGLFLKELDLPIPFLVCLATDPVAAGIIDSAEDTGDDDIWALVEKNPYKRQFEGYQSMFEFKNIGMACIDEFDVIAGNTEYRDAAKKLDVNLHEMIYREEDSYKDDFDEKFLLDLENTNMQDFDAFLFCYGTMDDDNVHSISQLMSDRGIPSLVGDGDSISKGGALMCLSCFDYEGYGNYAAMVLSNVLHGKKAGDQPCLYQSSPHIVMNMATAKKTGFNTRIRLLRSVDHIYR